MQCLIHQCLHVMPHISKASFTNASLTDAQCPMPHSPMPNASFINDQCPTPHSPMPNAQCLSHKCTVPHPSMPNAQRLTHQCPMLTQCPTHDPFYIKCVIGASTMDTGSVSEHRLVAHAYGTAHCTLPTMTTEPSVSNSWSFNVLDLLGHQRLCHEACL